MKKSMIILSVLLVMLLTVATASAADLGFGSVETNSDNITVPVVLSDLPSDINDLAAVTVRYSFDDTKIKFVSSELVALKGDNKGQGEDAVTWFNTTPVSQAEIDDADGVLFNINFTKVKGATGTTKVKITFAELADSSLAVSKDVNTSEVAIDLGKGSGSGSGSGSRGGSGSGSGSTKTDTTTPDTTTPDTTTPDTTSPDTTTPDDVIEPDINNDKDIVIKDIAKDNWAYPFAVSLLEQNIISGDATDGDYVLRPNDAITRQEAAKIVLLAMGVKPEAGLDLTFADANGVSDWAKDYIATAVKNGVISGYEDNTVRATNNITREEMVTMLIKAFGWGVSDAELNFADADKSTWSKPYLAKAVEFEVLTGYEDNTIKPNANITRAETFALVHKCIKINNALNE